MIRRGLAPPPRELAFVVPSQEKERIEEAV